MLSFVFTTGISILMLGFVYGSDRALTQTNSPVTLHVIDLIFRKYGSSKNKSVISETKFADLLKSINLGNVVVECQKNDTECLKLKNKYLGHEKGRKDPLLSRKKRAAVDLLQNTKQHQLDWNKHLVSCMNTKNFSSMYKLNSSGITKKDFLNLCPSLVQQLDDKVCVHHHKRFPAVVAPDGPPTSGETWGYGFLAITICSFLSLTVIAIVPCLKKSYYNMLMAYLIAVAVGTLAGDAMLHLIPHAFIEGANLSAEITVNKEQRLKQHYSQVLRAMFVLGGIYLFFCVEQFIKLKASCCADQRGHSHSNEVVESTEDNVEGVVALAEESKRHSKDQDVGHGHSHGVNKDITGETKIASIAWMVVVGDGFHNFSDGLAVGAAFSASLLSSGVSTTIAIFCHELPHELGDFAILLKAGMTIRQAIVYNLVSTLLAYVGLALGIVSGTSELGRHIILSITAGLFLYISLVDMMRELTEQEEGKNQMCTVVSQHLGLLTGIGIMLFISLYEHNM